MEPITPHLTAKPAGTQAVVFAKDQEKDGYIPLPTERTPDGKVVSRWMPSDDERARLIAGLDIYVTQLTFNQKLQPLMVTVGPPQL